MKKLVLGWVAFMLLMVVLAMPRYVRFPEDADVTIYNAEKSVPLAPEDAADLIERLNSYRFWLRHMSISCDCAHDFGLIIGEDIISGGGTLDWKERGLTLHLNEDDAREIEWIAEHYLERNG